MNKPLIFFAFANDKDRHLDLLKQESSQLYGALRELERREFIKLQREESAEIKDIYQRCIDYKDEVAIFHYAGHASGTHLQFESGTGDAKGLAQLLGEQESLKLVFLNGCSTRGQVETLFAAGVPAVIATSVEVEDPKAVQFAQQFYEALAHRRTISQAFDIARSFLASTYGSTLAVAQHGKLSVWGEDNGDELPWGLYTKEGQAEVKDWKLPYYRTIGLAKDMLQYIDSSFEANKYIVLVLDEMCRYNPDIYTEMVEQQGETEVKKDSKEYPWLIIKNYPWPIGSQIRLAILDKDPGLSRLQKLVSTYLTTAQVLYYILLSDLWDKCRNRGDGNARWEQFSMSREAFMHDDFMSSISSLYRRVNAIDTPFISEFADLVAHLEQPESPLNKAISYLETTREQLLGDQPPEDMGKACFTAEQAVAIVLKHSAFLAAYRMLTVRNVILDKPRFAPAAYELDMGSLNATQGGGLDLYRDAHKRRHQSCTDSRSVVLVASEKQLQQSLNLSPFIIDKNTFVRVVKGGAEDKKPLADVFMLAWQEEDRLHYLAVKHSMFDALGEALDQLHTDMTLDDFVEGKALDSTLEDVDFGDVFGTEMGLEAVDEIAQPRVFDLLKTQFDMLSSDLKMKSPTI